MRRGNRDVESPGVIDPELHPEAYPPTVPEFATEAEMAEFWDTHSSEPYWEELEIVFDGRMWLDPSVAGEQSGNMEIATVAISHDVMTKIRTISEARHVPYQALLREWIDERIDREAAPGAKAPPKRKAS